jgi:hypothetical protein
MSGERTVAARFHLPTVAFGRVSLFRPVSCIDTGMKKKYQIITVLLITLVLVGFFLSIYITVEEEMPDNAVVVITLEDKRYHSIHFDHLCVVGKTAQTTTLAEARNRGFVADPHCQELGYFRGHKRFLFHHLLSKLGFAVNSRWDKDGNWLW